MPGAAPDASPDARERPSFLDSPLEEAAPAPAGRVSHPEPSAEERTSYPTAQEQRAANMVWNAAGDYAIEPPRLFLDDAGRALPYENLVTGLVFRHFDAQAIRALARSWEEDYRAAVLDRLLWLAFGEAAYARERTDRPALDALHARFLAELDGEGRDALAALLRAGGAASAPQAASGGQATAGASAGEGASPSRGVGTAAVPQAASTGRSPDEVGAPQAGSPAQASPPAASRPAGLAALSQAQIEARVRRVARERYGFDGRVVKPLQATLHLGVGIAPRLRRKAGGAKGLPAAAPADADASGKRAARARHRGVIGGLVDRRRQAREADERREVRECFGPPIVPEARLQELEQRLCTGNHAGCRLWVADGAALPPGGTRKARELRRAALDQVERTRAFFTRNRRQCDDAATALAYHLRDRLEAENAFRERRQPQGRLDAGSAWRADALDDARVFTRKAPLDHIGLSVLLLLDGSGSRADDAPLVATQAHILAEGLRRAGADVRTCSFTSVNGYTVFRRFQGTAEDGLPAIMRYFACNMNRDGLALRVAGDALRRQAGRHKLLIVLTDGAPMDDRDFPPTAGGGIGRGGLAGGGGLGRSGGGSGLAGGGGLVPLGPAGGGRPVDGLTGWDRTRRTPDVPADGKPVNRGHSSQVLAGRAARTFGGGAIGNGSLAGRDYIGRAAVRDAANEVRALRAAGIGVAALFAGEDAQLADARAMYGASSLVRIRQLGRMADAAAQLIAANVRD